MNTGHKKYIFIYTFSYMAIGSMMPLIGQYLVQQGFTGTQVGTVTAAGTLVAIFASTFWGSIFDKCGEGRTVVMILCICAATAALVLSAVHAYGVFLIGYGIMFFFQAPIMGLIDAMCLEEDRPLGISRMWGAVGYALGVFVAGRAAVTSDLKIIFFMYAASYMISAIFVILMNTKAKHTDAVQKSVTDTKTKGNGNFAKLIKNRKYIKLIIAMFFIGGTNVANNTYFSFLYNDCGGSMAGMATAMLLMVGSEAPFMAWSKMLSDRFTLEKMIPTAMLISAARYGLYSVSPPAAVIMTLFFLQGMVNGIILVEIIRYIGKIVPIDATGLAVSGYYAISSNASTIICQMIGGIILDAWGSGGVYLFFAVYNMIGVILYMIFGLYKCSDSNS